MFRAAPSLKLRQRRLMRSQSCMHQQSSLATRGRALPEGIRALKRSATINRLLRSEDIAAMTEAEYGNTSANSSKKGRLNAGEAPGNKRHSSLRRPDPENRHLWLRQIHRF